MPLPPLSVNPASRGATSPASGEAMWPLHDASSALPFEPARRCESLSGESVNYKPAKLWWHKWTGRLRFVHVRWHLLPSKRGIAPCCTSLLGSETPLAQQPSSTDAAVVLQLAAPAFESLPPSFNRAVATRHSRSIKSARRP